MKKTIKIITGILSFLLTALSISEALKKKQELEKELKQN